MKSSALLKSVILIPLFLSCTISHAAEETKGDKFNTSKQKRYFHTPKPVKQYTSSEEENPISNTASSTEDDSLDDSETDGIVEAKPFKRENRVRKMARSASRNRDKLKKMPSKLFKKNNYQTIEEENTASEEENTDIKEQDPHSEKQITFSNPIEPTADNSKALVPEYSQKPKIQRQRSWGKNPHITNNQPPSRNDADESTPIIPQIRLEQPNPAHGLLIETNVSRKKKRLSHQRPLERSSIKPLPGREGALSPRGYLDPRLEKALLQERNPLQEGLSFYLNENGQPLGHQLTSPRSQLTSPRSQPTSPRLNHSTEKETTINLASFFEPEGFTEDSFRTDQETSSLKQDQPLLVVKYEENRGSAPFIRIMDNRSYRPDPRAVIGSGVLGSLIFAAFPPTAMTGINVNVTGYYFDIPPGEWLSTTLVTTFMTTFTLALLKEGYEWGQALGWPIWHAMKACYSRCTETKEHEDALSMPLFEGAEYTWKIGYKKNLLHYGGNGFSLIAALPEGILPTALLSLVWAKDYSNLIIPFGACLLVRYAGQGYNANTRIVRYLLKDYLNQEPDGGFVYMSNDLKSEEMENLFYQHNLDPKQAIKHKGLVREAIQRSLQITEENDDIAKRKYEIVNHERDIIRGISLNNKQYFALSALMSNPTVGTPINPLIMNCLRVQCQKGLLLIQKPIEFLKIPLKALALVGAGMAIDQGVTIFTRYWLPNSSPYLINASSGTLITFYAVKELLHLAKAVKEYGSPKASLATVPNFSLASFGATVPAGFSTLVGVILGFQYVDESESSQKWKALMAAYALDSFLSGHSHFKNKLQGFLTAAVTTVPEYTKECVVEYTPQFIKKGVTFLKEVIANKTPECLKGFMSNTYNFLSGYTRPFYQRSWLWKWHHDLDEEVNDGNDAVTNASFYFITQKSKSTDIYYDESSIYEGDAYEENVEYYFNENSG